MIINKLNNVDRILIDNEDEALEKLYKLGYEEVIVQSLHIICGNEYNKLKYKVENYREKFKKIELGRPLLTYIDDYKEVVEAIKYQIPVMKEDEVLLFMGHGTPHESHCSYSKLEDMIRKKGINAYISTIEGQVNLEDIIKRLKENNIKTIHLMPLLLVAGKHVINDMVAEESSWKAILEKENFKVETYIKGLGENPHIQYKFMKHACDCIEQV